MPCHSRRLILVASLLLGLAGTGARAATSAQVEEALQKAKDFLYIQMKEGNWEIVQRKAGNDGAARIWKSRSGAV